jgi:hypothetical protein
MAKYPRTGAERALIAGFLVLGLAACAAERPQETVDRRVGSGITSSNGGGMAPANFSTFGPIRTQ